MGKHMRMTEKAVAIALLDEGWSCADVAERFKMARRTIFKLKNQAKNLKPGEVAPKRKFGTGPKNKKLSLPQLLAT